MKACRFIFVTLLTPLAFCFVSGHAFADPTTFKNAGLKEETIVVFFGDHGSGMPRIKRFPYDCGLHVPFIVHFPEKLQPLAAVPSRIRSLVGPGRAERNPAPRSRS